MEAVKRIYMEFEFDAKVKGINCRCKGTKGYDIVNDDGSHNPDEYTTALNCIMSVLSSMEGATITFGDDFYMEDHCYGRLMRWWMNGKLGYVVWDDKGNITSKYENDGNAIPERKLVRSFLNTMIAAHVEANS